MSDDLRPPSLRDTRRLEDVVRHHGLILSKLAPGLFGGRSRIPDPIGLSDDLAADGDPGEDGDTDEPEWWDEDRFVVTGSGTITWLLTYVPVTESLFIRWGGVALVRGADWTLNDDGQTVTIPDQGFHVDDEFSAQYQFLDIINDDPPPPVPASLSLVGYTAFNTTRTTVALPVGTEEGDLLVYVAADYAPSSAPTCADSRITVRQTQVNSSSIGGSPNGSGVLVAYGEADSSGSDLAVTFPSADLCGILAAFRYTGQVSDSWIGLRDAVADGNAYAVPLPAASEMGIVALAGICGTVRHGFDNDPSGDWDVVAFEAGGSLSITNVMIAYNTTNAATPTFGGLSTPSLWSGLAFGVGDG